ncbi:hypothetical protein CALVIDRAFT_123470 [Calocera viscosa TUFC12733]|uniref:Uncharacterized protein n=1 Tax=Calocera viscosa (strain TUFC12733) TaxID=1330018 RepID=A0A167RNQ7_CALVF|nr:hypothetical protein CALVIDRAFT_123470 [Calocera viscosa TUFC12733]
MAPSISVEALLGTRFFHYRASCSLPSDFSKLPNARSVDTTLKTRFSTLPPQNLRVNTGAEKSGRAHTHPPQPKDGRVVTGPMRGRHGFSSPIGALLRIPSTGGRLENAARLQERISSRRHPHVRAMQPRSGTAFSEPAACVFRSRHHVTTGPASQLRGMLDAVPTYVVRLRHVQTLLCQRALFPGSMGDA